MTEVELAEAMQYDPLHWAEKYQELEAKNKRFREAAEAVMRHRGIHRYFKPMDVAIDALIALLEEADAPDR